jgi:hypothetical protein
MNSGDRRIYRVTKTWKWFTVVASPLLTALLAWGIREIIQNYLTGKGNSPLWLVVLIVMLLGILGCVFLGSILWAFRSFVVIHGDALVVRGIISVSRIGPDRMDGYRRLQGKMHLYLKDKNWAVTLAYYERQYEIENWVRRHAVDLDQQELIEEEDAIRRDITLGLTEGEKEGRLKRLRKIVGYFKAAAYLLAAVCAINFFFLKIDLVTKVTISALIIIPILLDLLAFHHRGHLRVDYREGTRYPQIFTGSMTCGVALTLVSLFDSDILFLEPFLSWFIPALMIKTLVWVVIDLNWIRMLYEKARLAAMITVAAFCILPAFWIGGSIYQVNKLLDHSPVIWNDTKVISKRISRSRTTSYVIKLEPWNKNIKKPLKINVTSKEFQLLVSGELARIGVRRGALNIPWVVGVTPATARLDL